MSGAEPALIAAAAGAAAPAAAATAAGTAGALGAGALGAGAAGAGAAAGGAGLAGLGSAIGNTALGTATSLGSGITAGASGLGMTAPASFGALGGAELAAAAPGMSGSLGSGLLASASSAPEAGGLLATAATPSSFTTPFTVSDALAKMGSAGDKMGKVNSAMNMMQPQQQGGQMIDAGPGTFEGRQRQPISPFGQQQPQENEFARMLLEKRMRMNQGLMG